MELKSESLKSSELSRNTQTKQPADDGRFSSWGCCGGVLLGLVVTLFIGNWFSNAVVLGLVGFMAGALVDRSRR